MSQQVDVAQIMREYEHEEIIRMFPNALDEVIEKAEDRDYYAFAAACRAAREEFLEGDRGA